jgi:hypothetical protein
MAKRKVMRKLGFAQAVKVAADRGLYGGEWMGYMGRVDGQNGLERAFDRLVNSQSYMRDESQDRFVMEMIDHSRLCHLERDGGTSKGHPAYYRQAALLGVKV